MKNKIMLLLLVLASLACVSQTTISREAAMKNAPTSTPTSKTESIRQICLTVDTVYLRSGAGTGYEALEVLQAGDVVILEGSPVIAADMGAWQPVKVDGVSGFVNSRYVCD